jgi:hypothetical protein
MPRISVKYIVVPAFCLLTAIGCGKKMAEAPTQLSEDQLKPVVTEALQNASQALRDQGNRYLAAIQSHNFALAYQEIRQLEASPDLPPDKRATIARAMRTTFKDLQSAADTGDQQAADALREQQMTK